MLIQATLVKLCLTVLGGLQQSQPSLQLHCTAVTALPHNTRRPGAVTLKFTTGGLWPSQIGLQCRKAYMAATAVPHNTWRQSKLQHS